MKDDGGPAFPTEESLGDDREGMSLRDYFAAKALQGLLAAPDFAVQAAAARGNGDVPLGTAMFCWEYADAMLKARF
jgi:hypothetical protein